MKLFWLLLPLALSAMLAWFAYHSGYRKGMESVRTAHDTVVVTHTVQLPPSPPQVRYLPSDSIPVYLQAPADTFFADCANPDTLPLRTYRAQVEDSLLSGTIETDVLGVMTRQSFDYTLHIPIIRETLPSPPSRRFYGIVGAGASGPYPGMDLYGGVQWKHHVLLGRAALFEKRFSVGILKQF